jgi:CYTH domain-containing protein
MTASTVGQVCSATQSALADEPLGSAGSIGPVLDSVLTWRWPFAFSDTTEAPMEINQQLAAALGFPKPAFMSVEHERRWLCRELPRARILRTEAVTDLYVTGARLRLREARPIDGGAPKLRLSRKADVDARTRLITSIYLPEQEFAVLAASLPGVRIKKLRHKLQSPPDVAVHVDEFQDTLEGLIMVEAEFNTADKLAAFPMPDFAVREVTDDPRYNGGYLAMNGLPENLADGAAQK